MLKHILLSVALGCGLTAKGALAAQSFSYTPDQAIPDANAAGWQDTRVINSFAANQTVQEVKITLDISGGYNGDLYAYLAHDGQQAVLLNRVGRSDTDAFGYADAGMNVQFSDAAEKNIHTYQLAGGSITGGAQWQPDGRDASPFNVTSQMSPSSSATLSAFSANQTLANGSWTLFVADLSSGGQSRVNSWSLQIQAVPEPIHTALAIFGGLFVAVSWWRKRVVRRK